MSVIEEKNRFAKKYLEFGWSIIPLRPPRMIVKDRELTESEKSEGKIPYIEWMEFQSRRPTEEEMILWFNKWPNANIAVVTGKISNLVILDIDGAEGVNSLKSGNFNIPDTPEVETGRGVQYYFKYPKGYEIGNSVGILPKVDVRADGGYVVAPPSLHVTGKYYKWIKMTKMAEMPDWLLNLITKSDTKNNRLPDTNVVNHLKNNMNDLIINMMKCNIDDGVRNGTLVKITGHLLSKNVNPYLVLVLMDCLNNIKCKPPLDRREVANIVLSIAERELKKRKSNG